MKTIKYYLLAAAAATAISCTVEITPVIDNDSEVNTNPEVELVPMTFTASSDVESKVAFGEEGGIVWQEGDKIMVIASTGTATEFTATEVDGKSATFKGLTENAENYYAVYPSSAYVGNDLENGKIYANVPETQTAVAGSFDRNAFLSIASNNGTELYFKNSCAIIGFKLANPADVKSVRFTANGQTNIAGTGVVKTDNIPYHGWDSTDDKLSSDDMITLNAPKGGFQPETEYFLTIRANKCPYGITVFVEYNDNVKSRSSKKPLFGELGSMNAVRHLGVLDENLTNLTPYELYNWGKDIEVAGKVINKAMYGEATLVTKKQGLNNDGVYFVNSDAEEVTMNSGKSIIVIGNDPTKRSKVSRSGYSYIPATTNADYWVFSNIDLTFTGITTTYTLRLNGGDVCDLLIMENCSSNVPTATQYIYGDGSNKVKELIIKDSEFLVEADATNNFLKFDATQTVDIITFDNNVFYTTDITAPSAAFTLVAATNTTATGIVLHKNTFYGAYLSTGSMVNCKSTDVTVTKNLFGLRSDATANVFVIGGKISGSMNFSENGYYKNGASKNVLTVGTSNVGTGTNDSIDSKAISTDNWNPSEGKFILNSGFGATR